MSRTSILEREDKVPRWTSLTVPLQSAILSRLEELGCAPYMAALGYAMPERTWSAEHTHAMRLAVQSDASERAAAAAGATAAAAAAAGDAATAPVQADSDRTAR